MTESLCENILVALRSRKEEFLIRNFEFRDGYQNELVCFLKPECFLTKGEEYIARLVAMVLNKFEHHGVHIAGVLLLGSEYLAVQQIMDRHYGFINRISKNASTMLGERECNKIQTSLSTSTDYKILGGHEFLAQFPDFSEESLDTLWLTKKSVKIQSGFYVQKYTVKNTPIVLINGFHPSQLKWYTAPDHKIVLFLLKSNTDWKILRSHLAGDTFPEKADRDSIRGEIFANNTRYGIDKVSVSNNCVHLSAGPFEGMFELNNFLHGHREVKFDIADSNMFRLMTREGLSVDDATKCLDNPLTQIDSVNRELFGYTEDKNSTSAITDYRKYFLKGQRETWK